jgi:ATP-binding cassette subfamily F protein uup
METNASMALLLAGLGLGQRYSTRPLFEGLDLELHEGDRLGIFGPNGAGKSSLLKILAGAESPSSGSLTARKGLRLGYLSQDDDLPLDRTVREIVMDAATEPGMPGHEAVARLDRTLKRLAFVDWDQRASLLSGGWRKRLALARQLVRQPDVLLLDEPTNHLDLEAIEWLEAFLKDAPFAWAMVSHDRYILERAATRIIEINAVYPNGFFAAPGSYSQFLERREDFLAGQARRQQALAGKVRREVEWLRRGPPARTTKSQSRVDQAGRMIDALKEVKGRTATFGAAGLEFAGTDRQSKKLLVADGVSKAFGARRLFSNVEFFLGPGVRLGLLGVNGSGKSTLLKIIAGELSPDDGEVWRADGLRVATFDQDRRRLDREASLHDALSPTGDTISFQGKPIHVQAWAKRFLFRSEQLSVPVSMLSGGEQARILLARLMALPADVLLLDEPTNDLDIPSLEVLEEALIQFPGAVVLVTHDRFLLERVSTVLLGIHVDGATTTCTDLSQWARARTEIARRLDAGKSASPAVSKPTDAARFDAPEKKKKLSFAERKELDSMEERIAAAEDAVASVKMELAEPAVMADHLRLADACARLESAQSATDALYARWQELEEKSG